MKILLVSMNSIHFRRWSDQLRDSGHEVYWFDVRDQGYAASMSWMTQITGWKKGFLKKRGRTFIKNKFPQLYKILVRRFDHPIEDAFAKALQEIQPDLVHSFALYVSCSPIFGVMEKYKSIPWAYSSWGSDLFYYRNEPDFLEDIKKVLPRVNYMFADCKRDQKIANELGFKGKHLGVFPGGGGFELELFDKYKIPFENRRVIAVKGNQNRSGRVIPVLKALENLSSQLINYEIVVFGVENQDVFRFQESNIPSITIKGLIDYKALIELLCESAIYIGNSNSDGMPNTLLEAMCAGAFPIQSNPGGATAEIIENNKNGLFIEDCEDVMLISNVIGAILGEQQFLLKAVEMNNTLVVPKLERARIRKEVIEAYNLVFNEKV